MLVSHAATRQFASLAAIAVFATACGSTPQPFSDEQVAALDARGMIDELLRTTPTPALGALVFKGDTSVDVAVGGVRSKGLPEPVTPDDRWHIGSDLKAMTATVVARLDEKGKLKFESTIAEVLPALAGRIHPDYRDVTVAQLLSHRSGVADSDEPSDELVLLVAPGSGVSLPYQRTAAVVWVLGLEPSSKPGSTFEYANMNYVVVGHMIETVTREPYEKVLEDEVLRPLGITTLGWGAPGIVDQNDQPRGHDGGLFSGLEPIEPGPDADNEPLIAPAGTAHLSLADWQKFVGDLLAGLHGHGKLLRTETYRRLVTPTDGSYAFGWGTVDLDGAKVITHSGSNGAWYAIALLDEERDVGVLVVANAGDSDSVAALGVLMRALFKKHR